MRMMKTMAAMMLAAATMLGCKDESKSSSGEGTAGGGNTAPASNPAVSKPAEHGRLPLGEKTVGALKLVATMDAPISSAGGGEGAFDLVITGGKPKTVRFWIGVESAEGSVKAKAEEETTDNWHTHAEAPKPLPAGSKFWAEVEPPTGASFKVWFDLKVK